MAFQLERQSGRACASGEMTIYCAAAMKQHLLGESLQADAQLSLDVSRVTEIDTCGIQVLLMLHRATAACGHSLVLLDPSPAVSEALALCGLDALHAVGRQAA